MAKPTESSPSSHQVQVWDGAVRVFHWLLVLLIIFMWRSGTVKGEWLTYHFYAGYAILALLVFRIIWGFVGGTHARFADFVYGPAAIVTYIKTLPSRTAAKFAGHNPLGGWSVVLMILCLAVQVGTGLFANNDDLAMEGPLAKLVRGDTSNFLTHIHHINFNILLALIAVHIGAVLYYLIYKKENLIAPMWHGRKHLPEALAAAQRHSGGWARALLILAMVTAGVFLLVR